MKAVSMRFVSVLFALAVVPACGGETSSECTDDCLEPTLTSIQEKVFDTSCAFAGCHNASTSAGGLDLSNIDASFQSLVSIPSQSSTEVLVIPNEPENSHLIDRIAGENLTAGQDRMPPLGEALSDDTISIIEQWIVDGCVL